MVLRFLGVVGVLLMGGCVATPVTPRLSPDHPASVDASQVPYVPTPSVLAEGRTDTFPGPASKPAAHDIGHEHHGTSPRPTSAPGMTGAMEMENAPTTRPEQMAATYTCSMHPEVVRNAPGECPKCGMPLLRQKALPAGEHQ